MWARRGIRNWAEGAHRGVPEKKLGGLLQPLALTYQSGTDVSAESNLCLLEIHIHGSSIHNTMNVAIAKKNVPIGLARAQ